MKRPSWVCTLGTQMCLCFALYVALNLGQPQESVYRDGKFRKSPDLYFVSVRGGPRLLKEQTHLLKMVSFFILFTEISVSWQRFSLFLSAFPLFCWFYDGFCVCDWIIESVIIGWCWCVWSSCNWCRWKRWWKLSTQGLWSILVSLGRMILSCTM